MAQVFVFRQVGRPFGDFRVHLTNSEKYQNPRNYPGRAQYWKSQAIYNFELVCGTVKEAV
jgi:hypothetical protein